MNIKTALIDLDNSWSRDKIMEKIKKGQTTDRIVKDFIKANKISIELVSNYLDENKSNLLEDFEKLSICEIKLINELKILQTNDNKLNIEQNTSKDIENKLKDLNFPLFLQKWSNNFVIYALILLSLISLTKQAWAL